jgi:hypothetical protein
MSVESAMKSPRTWEHGEPEAVGAGASHRVERLEIVRGSPRPRPRWRVLYAWVGTVAGVALIARAMPMPAPLRTAVDVAMTLVLFAGMTVWVRVNRLAIDLAAGPPHRTAPRMRVIRGPAPAPWRGADALGRGVQPGGGRVLELSDREADGR